MEKAEFDARFKELAPIISYGPLYRNVELSIFWKRPNDKVYAYCEAEIGIGELLLIICITDRCIKCSFAEDFEYESEWSEKILAAILERGVCLDWYARYYIEKKNGNWPMKMRLDEKLTSGFIEAYIPSLDTAAYLRSINHQFSEIEKATIIGNHKCLSVEEKIEALQRMKKSGGDEKLCKRLEQAVQLLRDKHNHDFRDDFPVWDAFHDFFAIPHNFWHGDIVHFAGLRFKGSELIGVILGYDEKLYRRSCKFSGDYSDVQITVDTRFAKSEYHRGRGWNYDNYLGEFSHHHINPIYIERARLAHDNKYSGYLQYLAACGTPDERDGHLLAEAVIVEQLRRVWWYYPEHSLIELISTAAKIAKLCEKAPQMSAEELVCLPEADNIDISKVRDFEVMDGLFRMQPQSVKKDL